MSLLMLRPNWPGTFKRVVRKPNGDVKRVLTFEPGKPVELRGAALAAVERAIGPALVEVELDAKGRPREKKQSITERVEPGNSEPATEPEQAEGDPQKAAAPMV